MTEQASKQKKAWGPGEYVIYGFLIGFAGVILAALLAEADSDATTIGLVVAGVGGLLMQIGFIAKAVEVGIRASGMARESVPE